MTKIFQCLIGTIFFFNICSGALFADPVKDVFTQVELLTDMKSIQPGTPFWVGLHMDMDDEWQVYWKNPGDSGLPTVIEWDLPDGFKAGAIQWPFPMRMDYSELTTYNYEDEVILLSRFTPPDNLAPGSIQEIKAHVGWLSCRKMCVQGQADLFLQLQVIEEAPSVDELIREMFNETMMKWPLTESGWDIKGDDMEGSYRLHITAPGDRFVLTQVNFFPEEDTLIDHTAAQILNAKENGFEVIIQKSGINNRNVSQLKGVLVSKEGWQEGRRALGINVPLYNTDK